MILLIDGYNLLKQIIKKSFASEQQLKSLISSLILYAKRREHKIIIVFDGEDNYFIRFKEPEVKLVYSGKNINADKYINLYVEQHKSPNLVVISSDRLVCSFALKQGVSCVDSITFSKKIIDERSDAKKNYVKKSTQTAVKLNETTNPELDKLMQEGSEFLMIKDENEQDLKYNKIAKSKTLSKQEKDLLRILKKL